MSIHLNNIEGFFGIVKKDNNCFKTIVQNESFLLRECKKDENGVWHGIVDNDLLMTNNHGLDYNDKVTFELIE